jgi:hypothetical protein
MTDVKREGDEKRMRRKEMERRGETWGCRGREEKMGKKECESFDYRTKNELIILAMVGMEGRLN